MESFDFNPMPTRRASPATENFSLGYEEIKIPCLRGGQDDWIDVLSSE